MTDKNLKEPSFIVRPNPDKDVFISISDVIRANNNYCCCAIEKTPDTMCICKDFREKEEGGFCHCGRFYKVKDFPIITILCHPANAAEAETIAEGLMVQGFIVLTPRYSNEGWYGSNKAIFDEIQRTQINMASVVFVMNTSHEAMEFMENDIYWAEELQKKIIYQLHEEVKYAN